MGCHTSPSPPTQVRVPARPRHPRDLPVRRGRARYRGPDGQMRTAPMTFRRERDAEQCLSVVESELLRGEWIDPWSSAVTLADFGQRWIKDRSLKPRTRDDYEGIFRNPHRTAPRRDGRR